MAGYWGTDQIREFRVSLIYTQSLAGQKPEFFSLFCCASTLKSCFMVSAATFEIFGNILDTVYDSVQKSLYNTLPPHAVGTVEVIFRQCLDHKCVHVIAERT